MCRHSGIVSKIKSHDLAIKMAEHQFKGGPDHTGFWSDDDIIMSHNRLSIIDTSSNGNQPMYTDRWVLSFVGEIYNYRDLMTKISPRSWRSYNDTETLLFYFDEFGIDRTLRDIEGMFSIALYDKIYKKLHLFVDPYSIKQMFWLKSDEFFVYGSSASPITFVRNKWTLNKYALLDMLTLGATKDPLFEGIKRMPGGSYLNFDLNTGIFATGSWYTPKEYQCSESDLMDEVKKSIQLTRNADVPSFIFLSGGIDSTVVASQCNHMNAVHLASPEEVFAKQAAEKYSNTLFFIDPVNFNATSCLEDYAFQSGDCSMAAIIPYVVSKEVGKFGKVAISANGADELFFGYNRMLDEPSAAQYKHIFRTGLTHGWAEYDYYNSTRELELETYVQYDLNKTLDFASMCHSLEVRVPFLNKTVVEMAMSIPRNQHVNGYGNKSILKRFLKADGFNDQFLTRPKIGFSLHTEPPDYAHLKVEGLKLLRNEFDIKTHFHNARDARYFEASAAAFYCWFNVWRNKLV